MRYREILLERNIANLAEIEQFVTQVAAHAHQPAVQQWVQRTLAPFLRRSYKRLTAIQPNELAKYWPSGRIPAWAMQATERNDLFKVVLDDEFRQQVAETIDYLESEEAHHNLGRIPFEVALQKSLQWHHMLASQKVETPSVDGVRLVKRYPDGYQWVMLTTAACLDAEGQVMGNCVGRGGYDAQIAGGDLRIFSLRDPGGESHVTAAFTKNGVDQVKGKQNAAPIPKYRPYVIDLLNALKLSPGEDDYDLRRMGIFYGAKGFGSLLDVAARVETLPHGSTLAVLGDAADTSYLMDSNGEIVLHFRLGVNKQLAVVDVDLPHKTRSIRDDFIQLLNGYLKQGIAMGDDAKHVLMYNFGLAVNNRAGTLVSVAKARGAKLIARDLLYRMVFCGSARDETTEVVVLDAADHPVVYFNTNKPSTNRYSNMMYPAFTLSEGWQQAIPVLLEGMKAANIIPSGRFKDELALAGWFEINGENGEGDWISGKQLIGQAELAHTTSNGGEWYFHNRKLWLWAADKVMAGLVVNARKPDDWTEKKKTEVFVVSGIDEAFIAKGKAIADDVVDIFDEGVAELYGDYKNNDPYLIQYNVYSDGSSFGAIDWNTPIRMVVETVNVRDHVVREEEYERTLGDAADEVGSEEMWQNNEIAAVAYWRDGTYEYEDESYHTVDDPIEQYEDPDEYRREHKMKPGAKLPAIAKRVITLYHR